MSASRQGPESLLGHVIGGYLLERELGRGLTGTVFLGRRVAGMPALVERTAAAPLELPALAAVKVLIPPRQASQKEEVEFRARFEREARTLQRLRHPHLVPVLVSGEEDGLLYMVLPYLPGGTLADRVASASSGLPLPDVERWLTQIAAALDYAHGEGIIHRDLKPANVLLDADDNAYLADFSIARLAQGTQLTTSKAVMGTYDYMAPEQASTGQVGPAADVYSLGCLVYQLITGGVPFMATEVAQVILKHVTEPPPSPRALRPDLPAPAEAAILKALAKRPEQRFAMAGALARAFREGLAGQWTPGLTTYVAPAAGPAVLAQGDVITMRQSPPHPPIHKWRLPIIIGSLLLLSTLLVTGTLAAASQLGIGIHSTSAPTKAALGTHTPFPPTVTVGPGTPTPTPLPGQPIPPNTPPGQPTATDAPTAGPTATSGPPVAVYGDGSDGAREIASNTQDAPLDATCSGTAGSLFLSFANASGPFAFVSGKPVLIHQSQGSGAGVWMRNSIVSAPGATSGAIQLASPLNANYTTGAQVIVLPQYTNVTVDPGVTWLAKSWNGSKGGILAFLANGTVTVNGTVSAYAQGFRGGLGGFSVGAVTGGWGEDQTRPFVVDSRNNSDATNNPGVGVGGGGGAGNQGGSGGNHGGGGGGGNGTNGGPGVGSNVAGGSTAGAPDLSTMVFGGGGGGGGASPGNPGFSGGNGGTGGGIIFIAGATIHVSGTVTANGSTGFSYGSGDNSGGGGGGAGGSIRLQAQTGALGSSNVTAFGGAGGAGGAQGGAARFGGSGGDGRVLVI